MSLVETFHQQHKERLARLGGVPPKSPNLSALEQARLRQQLIDLQAKVDRQKEMISDLNSTVIKQRAIISKFSTEDEVRTPRLSDIIAVVAAHFNMTKLALIGSGRSAEVAYARQLGYYLSRQYGYAFLPIGRAFLKDHSSVVHGSQKIEKQVPTSESLASEIETLKSEIECFVACRLETAKEMLA